MFVVMCQETPVKVQYLSLSRGPPGYMLQKYIHTYSNDNE